MIGADPAGGVRADRAREDAEVVGNVLIASRFGRNVRLGGDGTGESNGRYRFLNNTFIHRFAKPESHLHARFSVESVEMHNNVFFLLSGAVFDDARAEWAGGVRRVSGTANWVHRSARSVPAKWTRTITGLEPGLAGLETGQLRLVHGSPLIGAGVSNPASPPGAPFPNPTPSAAHHPPEARLLPVGGAEFRDDRPPDIGAFAGSFRPGGIGRETSSKNAPQTAPYGTGQTLESKVYRHDQPETRPKAFPEKHDGIQRYTRDNGGPGDAPYFIAGFNKGGIAAMRATFNGSTKLTADESLRESKPKFELDRGDNEKAPGRVEWEWLHKMRIAQGRFTPDQLATGGQPRFSGAGTHAVKVANWFDIPWTKLPSAKLSQQKEPPR